MKTKLPSVLFATALLGALGMGLVQASSLAPLAPNDHIAVTCDLVEIRMQNTMTETVKVTGEIWAQQEGGEATLVSTVPPQYQEVPSGEWGGPMDSIRNHFSLQFEGDVWGVAEMKTLDDVFLRRTELTRTKVICEPPHVLYIPVCAN